MAINRREFFKYLAGTAMAMFSNYASANEESKRLVKLGEERSKAGDLEGAMRFYEEAMKADPEDDEVWNNIGAVLRRSNKPEEALRYQLRAYELNNANCTVTSNLGWNYYLLGDNAQALKYYEEAVALCEYDVYKKKVVSSWINKLRLGK